MRLKVQLALLVLTSVSTMALALVFALRASTYRVFVEQQRAQMSWRPFEQQRAARRQNLLSLARLMSNDATLVEARRLASAAIRDYVVACEAHLVQAKALESARQAYLPSLWDIGQRLFLENEPAGANSDGVHPFPACADLFLLCQEQVILLESRTGADGQVPIRYPLDPRQDPPPQLRQLPKVADYTFYGDHLYQMVEFPGPAGRVILGDRVDSSMVSQASQLLGGVEVVALGPEGLLAATPGHAQKFASLLAQQLSKLESHSQTIELWLGNRHYVAACYRLGEQGWMVFLATSESLDRLAREQARVTAVLIGLGGLLSLLVVLPLAERIANPLLALSQALSRVARGDLDFAAPEGGPPEIAQACQAFNAMREDLRQKETLEVFVAKLEELRQAADPRDPLVRDQVQFGSHMIVERLGQGGMATVYRALPVDSLDPVGQIAIKVIHSNYAQDPEYRARFQREFELMKRLHHPGLVQVLQGGELHGVLYIAMELVDGESLRHLLGRKGALEVGHFFRLAQPILEAVSAAHQAGITHRDLKPENIMVIDGGIKIMDFGLATSAGAARLTLTGDSLGTPLYMAPEQLRGEAGSSSFDQYALGVVFYEMLVGHPPFRSDQPLALILMHLNQQPEGLRQFRPELTPDLESWVLKMLAKDPGQRFGDLRQALSELSRLADK